MIFDHQRADQERMLSDDGLITHFAANRLQRPLSLPPVVKRGLLVILAIAIILGGIFLYRFIDNVVNGAAHEEEAIHQALTRDVTLDVPYMPFLMTLNDESLLQWCTDAGFTIYDRTGEDGDLDIIKLPSDVSVADAGVMYLQGVNNLSGSSAAKLLYGSWRLQVSRDSGTIMRLHYSDFDSQIADEAMQSAMASQGLDGSMVEESGVDDAGNTFQTGKVTTDAGTFVWRISIIELNEVYSNPGLPSTAQYVGIRFANA